MLVRSRHKRDGSKKNQNRMVQRKYRVSFAALSTCQISEIVLAGEKTAAKFFVMSCKRESCICQDDGQRQFPSQLWRQREYTSIY